MVTDLLDAERDEKHLNVLMTLLSIDQEIVAAKFIWIL